jgi:O-antigen ligase/tetratricopeptide (TPR) repeat protein
MEPTADTPPHAAATGAPAVRSVRIPQETLVRVEWLLLLLALTLVSWIYPPRLQDSWVLAMRAWSGEQGGMARALWQSLEPFFSFLFSPLILRGAVAGVAMLAFTALCAGRWLVTGRLQSGAGGDGDNDKSGGRLAWWSAPLFLGWVVTSALWSPTPETARDAVGWALLFGVFFFVLLRRGISARERRQLAGWFVALGTVVLAILFLQALPVFRGVIFKVMYRFDESERNLYGSLIGHNTAAAAFVLLTVFPALGLAFTTARRWARGFLAAYLFAAIFGILLLQSRSIWALGPVLLTAALWKGLRPARAAAEGDVGGGVARRRWVWTVLLAAAAFGLLTQTIDRPWNPFYQRSLSLSNRMQDLSPESLMLESRLRLNVIGIGLVPEHPLIGHGLFAFQFIYPRHQGEYFATHPESTLQQTSNRSNMAHNEYLQVLIDHGAIGLLLLALLFGEIVMRGRRLGRALTGGDRVLQSAFGWSALGLALHAGVDFPFHVPQLLLPGIFCAAAWAAPRQPVAGDFGAPTAEEAPGRAFRPLVFARLLGALLMPMLAMPLGARWLVMGLQADALWCEAKGLRLAYEDFLQRREPAPVEVLEDSLACSRQAMRLTPGNYHIYETAMTASYHLGVSLSSRMDAPGIKGTPEAERLRESAVTQLHLALGWGAKTLEGLDYHYIYFVIATIYKALDRLEPEKDYTSDRLKALEKALAYCSKYPEAIHEIAQTLQQSGRAAPAVIIQLRRRIYRDTPERYDRFYVFPALEMMYTGRYETAGLYWAQNLQIDPTVAFWRAELIDVSLLVGDSERARAMLAAFLENDPAGYYSNGGPILQGLIEGRYRSTIDFLPNVLAKDPLILSRYRAIELEARKRLGSVGEAAIIERPEGVAEPDWERMIADHLPEILYAYFLDPPAARRAFERRLEMAGTPPSLKFWLAGVRVGILLKDEVFARENLRRAREVYPDKPAVDELARLADLTFDRQTDSTP